MNLPDDFIWSWHAGEKPVRKSDELAQEEPLEIQVETRSVCVTMRTPGHDAELAAGFLVSEGIIKERRHIRELRPYPRNVKGNVLGLFLAPKVRVDLASLTRHVYASSSCGLCGKATIDSIHQHFPPVRDRLRLPADLLLRLPGLMRAQQTLFAGTGGLHAAALFDTRGRMLVLREDVGRHNAVDKVVGHALLHGPWPCRRHILLVSGRASFEIVQKALAARLSVVAAVSAPSSLAVECARQSGITLVAFLRGDRLNVYSHRERLRFPASPA